MFGLRMLEEKDAPYMLEWMHDPEVNKYFAKSFYDKTIEDALAFIQWTRDSDKCKDVHFACVAENDEYAGTISLKNIDQLNGEAEYAISFHPKYHHTGAATYATNNILCYAFNYLHLDRVYLNYLECNQVAERFYEKRGFKEDISFHEPIIINGNKVDLKWKLIEKKEFSYTPLYSFILISYNNYKYIFEALDSILEQDYPNIELIISNDGTRDFKKNKIEEYLEQHRKENIKKILINDFSENVGTVANVEWCRKNSHGEFFEILAADDKLFDKNVISKFVNAFQSGDVGVGAYCGKVAMCTENINDIVEYIPTNDEIELIKENDRRKLFSRLSYESFMPTTSICLRSNIVARMGGFDTGYKYIEDATLYMRMVKKHIPFGWIDGMIGACHRDGGISHTTNKSPFAVNAGYIDDCIKYYEEEILPDKDMIFPDDLVLVEQKWNYLNNVNANRNRYSIVIIDSGTGLRDTLLSIFEQQYSNIEIIIVTNHENSELITWIDEYKTVQIRNVVFMYSDVKNYNAVISDSLSMALGQFIFVIRSGDKLAYIYLLNEVDKWFDNNPFCDLNITQVKLLSNTSQEILTYYPCDELMSYIENSDDKKVLKYIEEGRLRQELALIVKKDSLVDLIEYKNSVWRDNRDIVRASASSNKKIGWHSNIISLEKYIPDYLKEFGLMYHKYSIVVLDSGTGLRETLKSVFAQQYSNIEIIIALKHRDIFLQTWVEKNKTRQIQNIVFSYSDIDNYEETVARCISLSTGDFIYFIRSEDKLVFTHLLHEADRWFDDNPLFDLGITQVKLYKNKSQELVTYYPCDELISYMEDSDDEKILKYIEEGRLQQEVSFIVRKETLKDIIKNKKSEWKDGRDVIKTWTELNKKVGWFYNILSLEQHMRNFSVKRQKQSFWSKICKI